MKNKLTNIIASLLLASAPAFAGESAKAPPVVVTASESRLYGEVSSGYASENLWRGVSLGDDLVFGQLSLSYDVTDSTTLELQGFYGTFDSFDEDQVDGRVGVRQKFGKLSVLGGYSVFDFPDALGGTQQELYGGVEYTLPFNIVLGAVYNFSLEDDVKDYTEVSVSAPWVLAVDKEGQPTQSLVGKATQGLYLEEGEAVHTTLSLAYNYSVTKALTVSPFVEYNFVQDDYVQQEDGEYWGVKASFRF